MKKLLLMILPLVLLAAGCSPTKLAVSSVSYQSVRNAKTGIQPKAPAGASIMVRHSLSTDGVLNVYVTNLTDSVMIIDRTLSFFVNSNGKSTAYYDPTIKTTTTTDVTSSTSSVGVNLGAVAGAVGVGGALGRALSGINVGGSTTGGSAVTNTTYTVDQPTVAIGPRGEVNMSREFQVEGIGKNFLSNLAGQVTSKENYVLTADNMNDAVSNFSVTITYSLDGGKTFDKIVSKYYTDALLTSFVKEKGRTNAPLRDIYMKKPDALKKDWFILYFNTNVPSLNTYYNDNLFDYK